MTLVKIKCIEYFKWLNLHVVSMASSVASSAAATDISEVGVAAPTVTDIPIPSELLCFMQQRSKLLAFDDIIHICCDFYTYEEVIAARSTLERIIEDHRLPHHKRQVKEKSRKTLIDILKVVLDPKIQLPIFCTIDLSRSQIQAQIILMLWHYYKGL